MSTAVETPRAHQTPKAGARPGQHRSGERSPIPLLLLWHSFALLMLAVGIVRARAGSNQGLVLFWFSLITLFAPSIWALTRRALSERVAFVSAMLIGLTSALVSRFADLLLPTGYDEELHMRTLLDLVDSHSLRAPQPILPPSTDYPGLEAFTSMLHYLFGLPLAACAPIVILISRLLFVALLFGCVRQWTGSPRLAGLAVALYASCQQFYFFNTQYAYQTLALTFALGTCYLAFCATRADGAVRRSLLVGSCVCVAATDVTHHVTSWLTVAFLAGWALVERGAVRRALATIAGIGAAGVLLVVSLSFQSLHNYFGPLLDAFYKQLSGYVDKGDQRVLFSDGSGFKTPFWEQKSLIFYAGAITVTAVVGGAMFMLGAWRQRSRRQLFLGALCVVLPVTFVSRLLPSTSEFGDRSATFLFLPLAVVVVSLPFWPKMLAKRSSGTARLLRLALVALTTFCFIGGVLLGSGPDWERLPGPYLVAAENRSMDSYTLAAADWADHHLPQGSTIAADRIGGALLASRGRMYPVTYSQGTGNNFDPAALYFTTEWGPSQVSLVRGLQLSYLYVDLRWRDQNPHATVYFHAGEQPTVTKLSDADLTKFAHVPDIKQVYARGPIRIYDLRAFGAGSVKGWTGHTPNPPRWVELLAGLILALVFVGFVRSAVGAAARRGWVSIGIASGWAGRFTLIAALGCLSGLAVAAAGTALTPYFTLGLAVVILPAAIPALRRAVPASSWRWSSERFGLPGWVIVALAGVLAVSALVIAIRSAYEVDVVKVAQILGQRP